MNDKFLAWVVGTVIMAACCVGLPLLVAFVIGTGLFAWLANSSFAMVAVVLAAAAVYLIRRDLKRRPRLESRRERAVEQPPADDAPSRRTDR